MVLDILTFLAALVNLTCTVLLYLRLCRPCQEDVTDAAVEKAQKELRDRMDEGIENIMTYEVNGKTGFEPEVWREA
jgi:hypothetical protein